MGALDLQHGNKGGAIHTETMCNQSTISDGPLGVMQGLMTGASSHWQHRTAVTACRGGVWGTGQQTPLYGQLETGALTSPCGGQDPWRLADAARRARLQAGNQPPRTTRPTARVLVTEPGGCLEFCVEQCDAGYSSLAVPMGRSGMASSRVIHGGVPCSPRAMRGTCRARW